MPENDELFISAWAAIHTFEMKLKNNNYPVVITIIAKDNWLTRLIIPHQVFVTDKIEDVEGMKFELSVDMSDDRALQLAPFGRTAAACYGTLLGFDNVNELVKLQDKGCKQDIGILTWNLNSLMFANNNIERLLNISPAICREDDMCNAGVEAILTSKVVIGRRSIYTYLASCLNRYVIEFYPLDQYPRDFLAKWSNPKYKMIQVDTTEGIERNYQLLWRTLEGVMKSVQR